MAQAKLIAPFGELKGVVDGIIFQGYRGTTVMRTRTSGGGRRSTVWQERKFLLADVSSQWRTLTPVLQATWLAAAPAFPYIDKFGNPQIPSAFQLFVTLNYFNVGAGNPIMGTPPLPVVKPSIAPISVSWLDPATVNFFWTDTGVILEVVQVQATYPVSQGVTIPPSRRRFMKTIPMGTGQPVNIAPEMTASFGVLPQSGRLWVNAYVVSTASWEKWGDFDAFSDL